MHCIRVLQTGSYRLLAWNNAAGKLVHNKSVARSRMVNVCRCTFYQPMRQNVNFKLPVNWHLSCGILIKDSRLSRECNAVQCEEKTMVSFQILSRLHLAGEIISECRVRSVIWHGLITTEFRRKEKIRTSVQLRETTRAENENTSHSENFKWHLLQ